MDSVLDYYIVLSTPYLRGYFEGKLLEDDGGRGERSDY